MHTEEGRSRVKCQEAERHGNNRERSEKEESKVKTRYASIASKANQLML